MMEFLFEEFWTIFGVATGVFGTVLLCMTLYACVSTAWFVFACCVLLLVVRYLVRECLRGLGF